MNYTEQVLLLPCEGDAMVGVLCQPDQPFRCGLVIVVGGPQTRVGSHRQFVLLARRLATAGYPVLRFDYRGLGDSEGAARDFDAIHQDIDTAVDALQQACPQVQSVALWGLCDGATAAALYAGASPGRIAGLCLLNPWVRSEATLARTHLKHHYAARLFQVAFWRKLVSGQLDVVRAVREFGGALRAARRPADDRPRQVPFQTRMAQAMVQFPGQVLLVLSGNDYTAHEFLDTVSIDSAWRGWLQQPGVQRLDVAGADHTFSRPQWRSAVEQAVLDWMEALDP